MQCTCWVHAASAVVRGFERLQRRNQLAKDPRHDCTDSMQPDWLATRWNCRIGLIALWFAAFTALFANSVYAHKPSDSYLSLQVDSTTITGQWDIALRDLEYAIGLDANNDGAITWGELQARQKAVEDALARFNEVASSVGQMQSPF
jgi:hypothetical protein